MNIKQFFTDNCNVKVIYEPNWLEVNLYDSRGEWRRFFVPRTLGDYSYEQVLRIARRLIDKAKGKVP